MHRTAQNLAFVSSLNGFGLHFKSLWIKFSKTLFKTIALLQFNHATAAGTIGSTPSSSASTSLNVFTFHAGFLREQPKGDDFHMGNGNEQILFVRTGRIACHCIWQSPPFAHIFYKNNGTSTGIIDMFSATTNVYYFINIVPPFSKSWIRH